MAGEWVEYEGYRLEAPFLCMCCGRETSASQWAYGRTCATCDMGMCDPSNSAYRADCAHEYPAWRAPLGTPRAEAIATYMSAVNARLVGSPQSEEAAHD